MIDQIFETFIRAGNVIFFIFFISVYAWFLIIRKYAFIRKESKDSGVLFDNILKYINNKDFLKLDTYLRREDSIMSDSIRKLALVKDKNKLETEVAEKSVFYFGLLENHIGTITTLAAIAPLLGLLGTVTGMMKTFSIIKLFGSANPALMAEGISEALLTTQAGLVVAFPIVLANTFLKNRIRGLKSNFERISMKIRGQNNV